MRLFEDFKIRFEEPNWRRDPELSVIDSVLSARPDLISVLSKDISENLGKQVKGRQDTPSAEQIVRAAIYKELKGLDYRQLEYHQEDSRIAALFIKIDPLRPFSFQVYQKYISRIKPDSLQECLVELNRAAISHGLESLKQLRQDTTAIETDIHHPTNNSLVWDCIRKSTDHLSALEREIGSLSFRDYTKGAKKTYFKINNTKSKDARARLFTKQLATFTKCINQVANAVKKKHSCLSTAKAIGLFALLEDLLPVLRQVYDITRRKEICGEKVPSSDKIYSIFERHTDIICKGGRETIFGHKVNFSTGKNSLILDCSIESGNPADSNLYMPALERVAENYGAVPRDCAADGGFFSKANIEQSGRLGVTNTVFNKITGKAANSATSKNMETRLKKWRSGIEANISNLKRGFKISRCSWKGWAHFQAKVLWSVIGYNIRVMAGRICEALLATK